MVKPDTRAGYSEEHTLDCERVLVTLLRGLGPWKNSIFLVGGLTPRYIVRARSPAPPPHAGTQDVDVVVDLQILTDTEAYHTLEENLKKLGFERAEGSISALNIPHSSIVFDMYDEGRTCGRGQI